ncbi:hypothetical protein NN561_015398 [Cricetulus griseus]
MRNEDPGPDHRAPGSAPTPEHRHRSFRRVSLVSPVPEATGALCTLAYVNEEIIARKASIAMASSDVKPKSISRAKKWSEEIENLYRFQQAGYRDEIEYKQVKQVAMPLLDNRFEITNTIYEPIEEECEWKPDKEEEILEELKEKAKIEDEKKDKEKEDPKGIPEFWLTVFKNVDLLSDVVQEHDEPILNHLKDMKVKFSDAGQPMSFILEFHFEPNEYFTKDVQDGVRTR